MVLTWIGDVRPLLDNRCYLKCWEQLPDFRRKKADKYRFPMGRALSAGAWILWQRAREELCLPHDAVFNLSHSGYYAMCSAETNPDNQIQVGCDVEQISEYREGISKRFFAPEEYLHIKSQENPDIRRELFFRYWVLKESFMKATRQGMAMALDSFSFALTDGANPALAICPAPYQNKRYYFREFSKEFSGENSKGLSLESPFIYRAAVCSTDPDIDAKPRRVEF